MSLHMSCKNDGLIKTPWETNHIDNYVMAIYIINLISPVYTYQDLLLVY